MNVDLQCSISALWIVSVKWCCIDCVIQRFWPVGRCWGCQSSRVCGFTTLVCRPKPSLLIRGSHAYQSNSLQGRDDVFCLVQFTPLALQGGGGGHPEQSGSFHYILFPYMVIGSSSGAFVYLTSHVGDLDDSFLVLWETDVWKSQVKSTWALCQRVNQCKCTVNPWLSVLAQKCKYSKPLRWNDVWLWKDI